ncbi:conserved hypothetical protein [Ricinus communis]|uniref:Retrotransposon gag domain-containing protein n=1 Tax=Ricinus communis TaxID=3988 RepID=B9RS21_RICCO|nr:conserved hypothetical protein [Ricinus communis]
MIDKETLPLGDFILAEKSIETEMMKADQYFHPNWLKLNFLDSQEMIPQNGSRELNNFLSIKTPVRRKRSFKEENQEVTWLVFQEELWARFGPTECENFDEALSRVTQRGSLRDYQKEFEKLGNKVQGWTQRALVGTFIGGLKPEIAEGIRMFKLQSLKEAISLARMRDEQLIRTWRLTRPLNKPTVETITSDAAKITPATKRLSWEEMQKRRAQGLCFNCDE